MYNIDNGGLKPYSECLVNGMKKIGVNVVLSRRINYRKFDVVHIQFDYSLFHPFGAGVIPKILRLRSNGKKIVLTFGVVPRRKDIYARNRFVTSIKKIVLPIITKAICMLSDRIIVMIDELKDALVSDYKVNPKKIEVIPHGIY